MMDPGKGVKSGCFNIIPEGVPNGGILFVNNEAAGRSGHGGNTITECKNGDILCFYSNVSGEIFLGHGVAGGLNSEDPLTGVKHGVNHAFSIIQKRCGMEMSVIPHWLFQQLLRRMEHL
jgi:hypothetical protein